MGTRPTSSIGSARGALNGLSEEEAARGLQRGGQGPGQGASSASWEELCSGVSQALAPCVPCSKHRRPDLGGHLSAQKVDAVVRYR